MVDHAFFVDLSGTQQRPALDLLTLGGEVGLHPAADNADIISDALLDRDHIVTLPPGIVEIHSPILWPARSGCTLLGCGEGVDTFDSSYVTTSSGGTATRIVARFSATDQPMIQYDGKQGRMGGFSLEGYPMPGPWWNWVTGTTFATPIVVTTTFAHGLSDGDRIEIQGIIGNTNANGDFYIKYISTTTFSLYSDPDLADAHKVAGNATDTTPSDIEAIWRYYYRARTGIHVRTYSLTSYSTGKLHLSNVTFADIPCGILWGKNYTSAYTETATYDGYDDPNADESVVEHCTWRWPNTAHAFDSDVSHPERHRTASYHRTLQSLGFNFTHCSVNGWCHECSYFERGGGADLHWIVNGNAITGVLRIGTPNYQTHYKLWIDLDGGGLSENSVGHFTTILEMDRASSGAQVIIGGNHRAVWNYTYAVGGSHDIQYPMFVVRGPCALRLEDFNGLNEDCIQCIGSGSGITASLALVSFHGCTTYGRADMTLLFRGTAESTFPSAAPYVAKWYDCKTQFYNTTGVSPLRPITDGTYTTNAGSVGFAP